MSEKKTIRVRDVMKTKFDMVDRLHTINDALNQMAHEDAKCLVVNRRNEADEYGIVMISDIARQVLAKDLPPDRINIYEIMSKPAITVDPDMDIRYCARLFARFHLSRAPVVLNRNIVGIISLTDMVLKGLRKQ
ncbi:MAG: CBS domain-containing protein [Gammaproteobacteria bacterium]|nr:CBS domain-containing protein [Gammaproteobacteria bacterium]